MTLKRQLLLAISLLFFIVFAGLQLLTVLSTRDYLQQQMATHAQDAATTLSRQLMSALEKKDLTLTGIEVATVFDRGYYQTIAVLDPEGKTLLRRDLPASAVQVPHWMQTIFHLQMAPGEAFITSGWQQLGKVVVVSQPAYAYDFLWKSLRETTLWMLLMYGVACALTVFLLRVILRPLQKIEQVALAIRNRDFQHIHVMPKARELKRVVIAMNQMSDRIAGMLDEEIHKAEAYRREAYIDSVTGLENRAGFDVYLQHLLTEEGRFDLGALFLLEFDGLKEFNQQYGYQSGDVLLANLANGLRTAMHGQAAVIGRIGGTALAAVCLDLEKYLAGTLANALQSNLNQLLHEASEGQVQMHAALVLFTTTQSRAEIFSHADLAIESARQDRCRDIGVVDLEQTSPGLAGSQGWRTLICDALAEKRWVLFCQEIKNVQHGSLQQHEIFSRLLDQQGQLLDAQQFLPMALRHHLMPDIDKAVLTLIADIAAADAKENKAMAAPVAVNLSLQSLRDRAFCTWLATHLAASPQLVRLLAIEISASTCSRDDAAARKLFAMLRQAGVRIGIDNFSTESDILTLIRDLPPDYLKLDARLLSDSVGNPARLAHVRSILSLARSLDIAVYAQNLETEEQRQLLAAEQIWCAQGYLYGAPAPC
ncbi:MAG: EAL domain-containing protein [Burkholderiales bacterium]|nr:EAL domain-containing protein [Burkholderiales bacterium]